MLRCLLQDMLHSIPSALKSAHSSSSVVATIKGTGFQYDRLSPPRILLALARCYSAQRQRHLLVEAQPHLFSVPVSSKLLVDSSVDVAIKTGQMEQIVVKCFASESPAPIHADGAELGELYCLQQADDTVEVHAAIDSTASALKLLEIFIPERYCSVQVISKGQKVAVQGIHEAALTVYSGGGDITLGSIKASDVVLDVSEAPDEDNADELTTEGVNEPAKQGVGTPANISAKTITASTAEVCSLGGSINIGRLLGKEVLLNSQPATYEPGQAGGPITVTAAYTERLQLFSGGAPIQIGTLASSPHPAELWSSGGEVTVGSLDGHAYIESDGGNISLHVHDNIRIVEAFSEDGDISCRMSEGAANTVKWRFEGGGADVAAKLMGGPEDDSFEVEKLDPSGPGALHLNAHCGSIKVQKLSWIEAVQANARIAQQD